MENSNWNRAYYVIIAVWIGLSAGCSESSEDGFWRGREEIEEGVVRIMSDSPIRHPPDQTIDVTLTANLTIDGQSDQTDQAFSSVFGVTTDQKGNIYIADAVLKRILKFTRDGQYLGSIGSDGNGPMQFKAPVDMAVDAEGNIYVVDTQLERVSIFNPDFTFSGYWATQISRPRRIRLDEEGNVLLFTITMHDLIYKFKPNGEPINSFYDPLESLRIQGNLDQLVAYSDATMEATPDGYIVVSSRHPYWIRKFDRVNGLEIEFTRTTPFDIVPMQGGWSVGENPSPTGLSGAMAVFPNGRIMNIIQYQEFEDAGLNVMGMPTYKLTMVERWFDFFTPEGKWEMTAKIDVDGFPMHVDRQGRIYFVELDKDRIVRYTVTYPEGVE